jgi:kumamolisin
MTTLNNALQDAAGLGITVFAASADHLGTDNLSNGKANVDYPASSPWIIGCGGTQIDTSGNTIVSEVVWNDGANGWGTGGGISDFFPVPGFQVQAPLPPSVNGGRHGRGVPDVAGDAASASPYSVTVNGATGGWYGTSAVAPLWAGLTALLNQSIGTDLGFFLPALYGASPQPLREILVGNNKPVASNFGYTAGPGWNACTGLGVPTSALQAFFQQALGAHTIWATGDVGQGSGAVAWLTGDVIGNSKD